MPQHYSRREHLETEKEGIDAQLNKAVEVVLDELKANPVKYPAIPAFPDKTGK